MVAKDPALRLLRYTCAGCKVRGTGVLSFREETRVWRIGLSEIHF
jgi:hypothetical protein